MHELMRRVGIALLVAVGGGLNGTAYAGNDLPRAGKQSVAVQDSVRQAAYVGSQACAGCHPKDHAAWKTSWHANMHREVRPDIVIADFNGRQITYVDVEVDTPDKKMAKISPTIRLNRDGDNFTVTLIDKDDAANNQTWPIGYVFGGNWNQHFEARVGNVSNKQEKEIAFPTKFRPGDVDLAQRVDFWNFGANPKNFWSNGHASKNRQQLHDGEFSKHRAAGVTCITCHDTHSSRTGYAQVRLEKNALCAQCHQASAAMVKGSAMAKAGVGCVDCHMAKLANRSDPTQKNKDHWDASAHTMAVIQPADGERMRMKSSCDSCHAGADRAVRGEAFSRQQNEFRSKMADVERIIGEQEKSGRNVAQASKLVATVTQDGGASAHNPQRALATLDEAAKVASP